MMDQRSCSSSPQSPTHPQEWTWTDDEDEEWDGEWEEWAAVADDQCEAATTTNSHDARSTATMWTEPPVCPAVHMAPKAPQPAFAFFSSSVDQLCPAPVSPLLQ